MSKPKLIRPSDLNQSNRELLAMARQAGLCPVEIIRKSLQAAYGELARSGGGGKPVRTMGSAGKNHHPQAKVKPVAPVPIRLERLGADGGRRRTSA